VKSEEKGVDNRANGEAESMRLHVVYIGLELREGSLVVDAEKTEAYGNEDQPGHNFGRKEFDLEDLDYLVVLAGVNESVDEGDVAGDVLHKVKRVVLEII